MISRNMLQKGLIYGIIILAMLSCRLPFDLLSREAEPVETVEEIAEVVSTEEEFIPTETMAPTLTETPEPTPTETMAPTPTETPDPISLLPDFVQESLSWSVLFEEDFVNPDELWWTDERSSEWLSEARDITNAQYVWTYENITMEWPLYANSPVSITDFSNFYASAAFQLVDGTANASYGFTFRHGFDGNYMFSIRGNSWRLAFYDHEETLPIIDWQTSEAIIPGGMNELAVAAHGEQIALMINGELVAEITDDTLSRGRVFFHFDLAQGEKSTLVLDNYQLRTDFAEIVNSAQGWGQYQDNLFVAIEEDWFSGSVEYPLFRGDAWIEDGRYKISGTSTSGGFNYRFIPDQFESVENAYLTLDISPSTIEDSTHAGLVFQYSDEAYYYFRATTIVRETDVLLRFDVVLYYQNEWETLLSNLRSKFIEEGQTSQLGVIFYEDHLIFLVDGTIQAATRDSRLTSGTVGVAFGAWEPDQSFDWEFSAFNIYLPD